MAKLKPSEKQIKQSPVKSASGSSKKLKSKLLKSRRSNDMNLIKPPPQKLTKVVEKTTTTKKLDDVTILAQSPATKQKPVQCWALKSCGSRCQTICTPREGEPIPIPYCDKHLQSGADYALKVVSHPIAEKCLVARFDLPKNYRMVFFGRRGKCPTSDREDRSISFYPPNPVTGSNCLPGTRTLKRNNYNGVLNPKDTADVLQYAACPGPNERQNIRSTFRYWGVRHGEWGGLEFVTLEKIPKNTMLCHWYGSGWWSARNIQRIDVGLPKYPAPRRHGLKEKK
jgi:hypothetical protein